MSNETEVARNNKLSLPDFSCYRNHRDIYQGDTTSFIRENISHVFRDYLVHNLKTIHILDQITLETHLTSQTN